MSAEEPTREQVEGSAAALDRLAARAFPGATSSEATMLRALVQQRDAAREAGIREAVSWLSGDGHQWGNPSLRRLIAEEMERTLLPAPAATADSTKEKDA